MKPLKSLLYVLPLLAFVFTSAAHAQSNCQSYLQTELGWVAQDPYGRGFEYTIATNQAWRSPATHSLVSYTEGFLGNYQAGYSYYNPLSGLYVTVPASVSSTGAKQYFNDRRYGGTYNNLYPFNASAADSLGVRLEQTGRVTITLESWGNGSFTITNTTCANGVIYGFSNETNPVMYVIALTRTYIPG